MTPIQMEWYRMFMYTAQLGNLTKAAQKLHVTQPSVSYAIKQLEEALDVKLFDRRSKGVDLTQEGRALLDHVEKAFQTLTDGEHKLQSMKQLHAGDIRIGASGAIIKHILLPILDAFHAKHPDIRIKLSQGKTSEIARKLRDGSMDVGFVHLPLADPELDVKPFMTVQNIFVVGEPYRDRAKHPLSTERLLQIPLLLLSPGSNTRLFLEQWLSAQGLSAEVDMELSSVDMLVEFAQRGYGSAFVARSYVRKELAEDQLFELPTIVPIPPSSLGIARRRDTSISLAAAAFMELLEQRK